MNKRLIEKNYELNELTTTTTTDEIDLNEAKTFSVQAVIDVNTPSAKTFDSGESEVTTLTFANKAGTAAGDYVVIYDTTGEAWAVAADLDGDDPEPTGAIWDAIPAAQKGQADLTAATDAASVAAAFELAFDALVDVPFATDDSAANGTMLVTVTLRGPTTDASVHNEDDSGAGSIAEAQTNQGVASEVNDTDDELTIPSHGLFTGLKGQLTTTGTLPTGLSLATDYFVIEIDTDTIQLAASLADALAGTPIDITSQGADGSVNTFTPTALAGASIKLQKSNDGTNWSDEGSATNITADAVVFLEKIDPTARYMRVYYTLTAGSLSTDNYVLVRGDET